MIFPYSSNANQPYPTTGIIDTSWEGYPTSAPTSAPTYLVGTPNYGGDYSPLPPSLLPTYTAYKPPVTNPPSLFAPTTDVNFQNWQDYSKIDASSRTYAPTDTNVYAPTDITNTEVTDASKKQLVYNPINNTYVLVDARTFNKTVEAPVVQPPPTPAYPPAPVVQQQQQQITYPPPPAPPAEKKKGGGFGSILPWILGAGAAFFLLPKLFNKDKPETPAPTPKPEPPVTPPPAPKKPVEPNEPEKPVKPDEPETPHPDPTPEKKTRVINISAGGDVAVKTNATASDASNPAREFFGNGWKRFNNDGNIPGTYEIAKNSSITARYTTKKPTAGSTGTIISKVDVYFGGKKIVATPKNVTIDGKAIKDGYSENGITFSGGKLVIKAAGDTMTVDVNATSSTTAGVNTPSLAVGYADAREVDEHNNITEGSKQEENGALLDLNEINNPSQSDIKQVFQKNKLS